MADLPTAPVKKIMMKQGLQRVSAGAVAMAQNAAEDFISALAQRALRSAQADKRKTVMEADVDLARKELMPFC